MAQLVARLHGMEEVWGSNPHSSTRRAWLLATLWVASPWPVIAFGGTTPHAPRCGGLSPPTPPLWLGFGCGLAPFSFSFFGVVLFGCNNSVVVFLVRGCVFCGHVAFGCCCCMYCEVVDGVGGFTFLAERCFGGGARSHRCDSGVQGLLFFGCPGRLQKLVTISGGLSGLARCSSVGCAEYAVPCRSCARWDRDAG
jgi:hypothetical protein